MLKLFNGTCSSTTAVLLLFLFTFAQSGCSGESLKRFAFDLGDQYSCSKQNEDHVYESVEDLQCTGASKRASYEDFKTARSNELSSK